MQKEFLCVEQLRFMPRRVELAEETFATSELNMLLWQIREANEYKPIKIMVVGAGGSFPAALFAKQALTEHCGTSEAEAYMPQSAIRILTQFSHIVGCKFNPYYHVVIAISYSGKTPDIQKIYEICRTINTQFILVTKALPELIDDLYPNYNSISTNIVSYDNVKDETHKERGAISMAATVSPAVIFDDLGGNSKDENMKCFEEGEKYVQSLDISKIAEAIKQRPVINVFYEWDTMPTAYDIETKFTQAGLAHVVLHEKKNFSHGRYVSLYTLNSGLNINLVRYASAFNFSNNCGEKLFKTPYDEALDKFLEEISLKKDTPYIKMGSVAFPPNQWNIEAMTKLPYLLVAIGQELGIDVSKPLDYIPEKAFELFNYIGGF
jgi:hypothetical protein